MKKKLFVAAAFLAFFCFVFHFTSCSNSSNSVTGTPAFFPPVTAQRQEVLQSKHARVEKVKGGLMFYITRPTEDCFRVEYERDGNGNVVYNYQYLGDGNGNFAPKYEYVYVGEGNGQYKKNENGTYVPWPVGDYAYRITHYEEVGQGNGSYTKVSPRIVSYGWTNVFITTPSTPGGLKKGFVEARLDLSVKNELTAFWPLCEPGKLCEYTIHLEPCNSNLRKSHIYETLIVAADEGIGGLEKAPKCDNIILSYDGQKQTVKFEGFEPPIGKIQNLKTRCEFFSTNQSELKDGDVDFDGDNTVVWFYGYTLPDASDELVWDDSMCYDSRTFNQMFDATGKDTLYVTCKILFDISGASESCGVAGWSVEFNVNGEQNLRKIKIR